jgi:hypothetical protein
VTSSATKARRLASVAILSALTLLVCAVGARAVGSSAQAATTADLAQLRDQALATLDRAQPKGTTAFSVGIDPSQHRIGVYLFTAQDISQPALVALRTLLGPDVDLHTLTGTPHPLGRTRGGEGLQGPLGWCTTGFAVGLRDGRQGFLTSGHCFDPTRAATKQSTRTIDGQTMTGLEYNHGPSDWGIFILDNADDEAVGTVGTVGTTDGGHPVRAVTGPTTGMPICKTGVETGTTCGGITLLDDTQVTKPVYDANGVIIYPPTRLDGLIMNNLCTEVGDSGAPVYTTPASGQNAPIDAVGIIQGAFTVPDGAGNQVCLEKLHGRGTSVSWAVPLSATPAATTSTANTVHIKTSS